MVIITCKNPKCNKTWDTKSKNLIVSCPGCLTKNRIYKDESIINIGDEMRKLKVDPEYIYQEVVESNKNGACIKANSKYIGKKATIIIDKKSRMGMTDKEGRELADAWERGSI